MEAEGIRIEAAKCRRDGICVNICPVGIFQGSVGEVPVVDAGMATACIKCGHCSAACPAKIPDLHELRSLVSEKIGLANEEKVFGAVMLGYPKYDYCRVPPRKPLNLKVISN